jgi:signal transduction histidine kinase
MRANFVRRLMDRDPKAASEELFKMEDLARKTTKEIRHMLFTLRPLVLESQGLTAAVEQLAEKIKENHNQEVIVESAPDLDERLEISYQGVLFYIIEEAVNNARKHAQAEHIWVRLNIEGEVLAVEIEDDGVGFNVGAMDSNYKPARQPGHGQHARRAEMIGGAVRLDSAEGRGHARTGLRPPHRGRPRADRAAPS